MKKILLLLLLIGLVSTAALAQNNKPAASNYAPYRDRTDYEMRHLGIAEFVPGMNYEQMLQDITDAINKVEGTMKLIKKLGDNTIEITDDDGKVYKRKSFTTPMTEDMMIRCSERVDPSLVGDLNVAGWKMSGDDVECVYGVQSWKNLGNVRGFSIGDFYKIPSMKKYWIVYQKERCLNPARKLVIMKTPAPVPQENKKCDGCTNNYIIINSFNENSFNEGDNVGNKKKHEDDDLIDHSGDNRRRRCAKEGKKSKSKETIHHYILWKRVRHEHYCIDSTCTKVLVRVDTVTRATVWDGLLLLLLGAKGEDYACTQNYWRGHDHTPPPPNPGTNGNDTGQTTGGIPTGPGHKSAQKMASNNSDATHGLIVPNRFNHPDSRFPGNSLLKKPIPVMKPVYQAPPKINLNLTYKVTMNFIIGSKKPFSEVLLDGLSSLKFRPTYIIK